MIKRFFAVKIITASCVVLLWYAFVITNMIMFLPKIEKDIRSDFTTAPAEAGNVVTGKLYIDKINYYISENVWMRYQLINIYGLLQRLMGKNEENNFEVVKDEQGFGHYMFFGTKGSLDPVIVPRIVRLQQAISNRNTKLVAIVPLERSIPGYTSLATGLPDGHFNEQGDLYVADLQRNGIAYLDLRTKLQNSGLEASQLFFATDHHWRIETAFWAYTEIAGYLNQKFGFPVNPFYLKKENYNFTLYKNSFVGSIGRKTGIYYLGVDDFTLIYPKFPTEYSLTVDYGKNRSFTAQGRFEESLIASYPFTSETDPFDPFKDKYSAYLYGNYRLGHIVNKNNPTGPKVLFIKDSMAPPVAAFLSGLCSEIWMLDPRYYPEGIEDFIASTELDYIILMFSLPTLTPEFFPFYPVPG